MSTQNLEPRAETRRRQREAEKRGNGEREKRRVGEAEKRGRTECGMRIAECGMGEEEAQAESRETKGEGFVRFHLTRREDRV